MTLTKINNILLTLLAATALGVCEVRADMVARYTLDDDSAGIQNLGSDGATSNLAAGSGAGVTGGPTFNISGGKLGGYASFDGNQTLITTTVGNAGDDLTAYPFTLSAWIKPLLPLTTTNRGAAVAIANTTAASTYFTLGVEASSPAPNETDDVQAVRRNTGFLSTEGTGTATTAHDGNWHHIAVVNASSTSSRIYFDGVQVGSNTTAVSFSSTVNSISLGGFLRSNTSWTDKYRGDIDEVQIYNEALIASQIQYLTNSVVGPPPPVSPCDVDLMNGCTLADLQIIADHFFTNTTNRGDGDLNSDGIVNFADFRIWKDASGSGASFESLFGSVPEPATIGLLVLAAPWMCSFGARHRMRRRVS